MFCTTEVTELENSAVRIQQKVLRFDVAMTNPMRVDVGQRPEERDHYHVRGEGTGAPT